MTLHTFATAEACTEKMLAGQHTPTTRLEEYLLLRAIAAGRAMRPKYDPKAALQAGAYSALLHQAAAQCPPCIRGLPGHFELFMAACRKQISDRPPVEGMLIAELGAVPRGDRDAHIDEIMDLHRFVINNPAPKVEPGQPKPPSRLNDAQLADVEQRVARGEFGALGAFLDARNEDGTDRYSAVERLRALLINRFQYAGKLGNLATVQKLPRQVDPRCPTVVRELQVSNTLARPHVACKAPGNLIFLSETQDDKPSDAFVEGLGSWVYSQVPTLPNGGFRFVPKADAKQVAA